MAVRCAEEPRCFAVTAGIARQTREAFEDDGNGQVSPNVGGARECVMGVACAFFRLPLRDCQPGACQQRCRSVITGRVRNRLVGPTAGRDQISARYRVHRFEGSLHRRVLGHGTHIRPGLDRVPQRRNIPIGLCRKSQCRVAQGGSNPTQLGGALDGRGGGGPGRRRVTLARQHDAAAREANHLNETIVSGLGLGDQLAELCGGTDQITLK